MPDIAAGLRRLLAAAPDAGMAKPAGLAAPLVSVSATRGVVRGLRWPLLRMRSRAPEDVRDHGIDIIRRHPELFGGASVEQIEIRDAGDDPQGGLSIVVQQCLGARRVRVRGGAARFHADRYGTLDVLENRLFVDLGDVSDEPRIAAADAVTAARGALGTTSPAIVTGRSPARQPELLVISHSERAQLVWRVCLREAEPYGDRVFAVDVDAARGNVLDWRDDTQEGAPAQGTGRGHYAGPRLRLHTWREGPRHFELRDVTREPVVIVTHVDGGEQRISVTADNDWSAPERHAEADAHHFAGVVVDYFKARGGRHRQLGQGGKIHIYVHSPVVESGGKWDPVAKVVRLSDGDGQRWGPCSSLDWVAHELVHSYTQATCDLTYRGESGALNEAISDTFAALIRDELGGARADNWGRFKESWRGRRPPAPYRNMTDPRNRGAWSAVPRQAAEAMLRGCGPRHVDEMYRGTIDGFRWDHGGVHVNSGIINHLFYLLAKGGKHKSSKIDVEPIGNARLESLLFRCIERHLPADPNCDFRNFRRHMVAACLEAFDDDLVLLERLKRAFRAVGIGPDLIIRDNPRDDGSKRVPAASALMSPDIISRQVAVARPSTELADPSRHDLGQDIRAGHDNFVYVRVRNTGSGIADATVGVFLAGANEVESPRAWQSVPGDEPSGTLALAIGENEFRVVGPFILSANRTPAPGSYCLIAIVSSAFDPVPSYRDTNAPGDYLAYLRNTNNVAARKLRVVASG